MSQQQVGISSLPLLGKVPPSAELMAGLLEHSPYGIIAFEAEEGAEDLSLAFRPTYVNPPFLTLFGLHEADIYHHNVLDTFLNARADWPRYQNLLDTAQPFVSEFYHAGTGRWIEAQVRPLGRGFFVTCRDISSNRLLIQDMDRQRSLMTNLLRHSPNGLVVERAIRDHQRHIIDFQTVLINPMALAFGNHNEEEVLTKTIRELNPLFEPSGLLDAYRNVIRTGDPFRLQFFHPPIGRWLELTAARMDEDHLVAVFDDITGSKEMQLKQDSFLEDLRRSNESLEQFAYEASHDLQEPLRKIQSFARIMVDQYSHVLDNSGQDLLRRMDGAASRMQTFIRDLLTYSRLSTQQEPFRPVSVAQLFSDILADFETSIREKQADISLGELPVISGNPIQLRQLFQNLLSNALKFTKSDEAPRIVVGMRPVLPGQIPPSIPETSSREWIAIDVSDNGIGFSPQHSERVFQLFQRLNGRSQYAGTGIGLAICRKVAENHGGTIIASSSPGVGTTFTVFLPR